MGQQMQRKRHIDRLLSTRQLVLETVLVTDISKSGMLYSCCNCCCPLLAPQASPGWLISANKPYAYSLVFPIQLLFTVPPQTTLHQGLIMMHQGNYNQRTKKKNKKTTTLKQSHVEMLMGSCSAFAHLLEFLANGLSINISLSDWDGSALQYPCDPFSSRSQESSSIKQEV